MNVLSCYCYISDRIAMSQTLLLNNHTRTSDTQTQMLDTQTRLPDNQLHVIKRDGSKVPVKFDAILRRIERLSKNIHVNPSLIAQHTIASLVDNIKTSEIDKRSVDVASNSIIINPDYDILAARISISDAHKACSLTFSQMIEKHSAKFDEFAMAFVRRNAEEIDATIVRNRDYNLTSLCSILAHRNTYAVCGADEIPQYTFARTAVEISLALVDPNANQATDSANQATDKNADKEAMKMFKKAYDMISMNYVAFGSPTFMNSMVRSSGQLLSCYLIGTEDSRQGITQTWKQCGLIGADNGGIGVHISNIRTVKQPVAGGSKLSSGIMPNLKTIDSISNNFQHDNRRSTAISVYINPTHPQTMDLVAGSHPTGGTNDVTFESLKTALIIPDLFYKRAMANENWSMFSPDVAPELFETYDGMQVCKKCWWRDVSDEGSMAKHQIKQFEDENGVKHAKCSSSYCDGSKTSDEQCEYEPKQIYTMYYLKYERLGKANKVMPAKAMIKDIISTQRLSGLPYHCCHDMINRMNAMRNIGVVKGSNLCIEIVEPCANDSIAACVLSSVALRSIFFKNNGESLMSFDARATSHTSSDQSGATHAQSTTSDKHKAKIDHNELRTREEAFALIDEATKFAVEALNCLIKRNKYPMPECEVNIRDYRTLGIGIQGFYDVIAAKRVQYESTESFELLTDICEQMYHSALSASCDLAEKKGAYTGFDKSPAAKGQLHFDLWEANQEYHKKHNLSVQSSTSVAGKASADDDLPNFPRKLNWDALKARIMRYGLHNALLIAHMPTNLTSRLYNQYEMCIPPTGCIETRVYGHGKFFHVNSYMIKHLIEAGLWTDEVRKTVMEENSIQNIPQIPDGIKMLYKTVWEMSQKTLMKMLAVRSKYIDQSSSFNVHLKDATDAKLSFVFMWGWKYGLKTVSYYMRTQAATRSINTHQGVSPAQTSQSSAQISHQSTQESEKNNNIPASSDASDCPGCSA